MLEDILKICLDGTLLIWRYVLSQQIPEPPDYPRLERRIMITTQTQEIDTSRTLFWRAVFQEIKIDGNPPTCFTKAYVSNQHIPNCTLFDRCLPIANSCQ